MSKHPELVTFAATKERVALAIQAGIDHLVLEDSKVSIRSLENHFVQPDFQHVIELAFYARTLSDTVKLSVNCDVMVHERHYPVLEAFYQAVRQTEIDTIRIQDPGLIPYFKSVWPEVKIHFAQETGNHNIKSIGYYAGFCERQILNNELTSAEIKHTLSNVPSQYEIQVQGPLLIQYSNRRFMAGRDADAESNAPITLTRYANDQDYPGREFVFHDNPHGHFMYAYFDRCLLRSIPELLSCSLTAWLIDARGESDAYLTESIRLYKKAVTEPLAPGDFSALESVSKRAQKPGFFKANFTDRVRKSPYAELPENSQFIGMVVDVIREKWVTIRTEKPFKIGDELTISSPRAKVVTITVDQLKDVTFRDLESSEGVPLVLLKWRKGVLAKSKVFKAC